MVSKRVKWLAAASPAGRPSLPPHSGEGGVDVVNDAGLVQGLSALFEEVSCIVCGSDESVVLDRLNGHRLGESVLRKCRRCGLRYYSPRFSKAVLRPIYSANSIHYEYSEFLAAPDHARSAVSLAQKVGLGALVSKIRGKDLPPHLAKLKRVGRRAAFGLWQLLLPLLWVCRRRGWGEELVAFAQRPGESGNCRRVLAADLCSPHPLTGQSEAPPQGRKA